MPNRILREGILSSERIDALPSWAAEVFYRRLHSVVDDFGRYYARAELLRAACYPLKLDDVSNADIETWVADCENAALLTTYMIEGKRYLQLRDFRQQRRAEASKYPNPPPNSDTPEKLLLRKRVADATHLQADSPVVVCEGEGDIRAVPALPPGFMEFWSAWPASPRKVDKAKCLKTWIKHGHEKISAQIVSHVLAIKGSSQWRNGYEPAPTTYLNGRRWEDGDEARPADWRKDPRFEGAM